MNLDFKNKLINGDSLQELKKIPDETFDLIFEISISSVYYFEVFNLFNGEKVFL